MEEDKQKTFSETLTGAMRSAGYSIERLSKETGISERFITLLAEGRMESMPPAPYVHGYLVRIGEVLKIDGEALWKAAQKEAKIRESGAYDKLPSNRFITRHINTVAVFGVLALVGIVGYFLIRSFYAADVTNALQIRGLENDITIVGTSSLDVNGRVDGNVRLTIDELPVYPDENGAFSRTVELQPGMNALVFELKGLLGRTGKVIKHIFYKVNGGERQGEKE